MKSTGTCSILAVLSLLVILAGVARPSVRAQGPAAFGEVLDGRMPGLLAKYGVPGAVVSYIEDGVVTWTRAYGLADEAAGTPMSPEMVFNFGSTGKVLTAWGVMRLVEQGLVDLDAPVNGYLRRWQVPAGAYDAAGVTVRRLLSHTAGLSVPGYTDYSPRRQLPTLVEMLEGRNQMDGPVEVVQAPGTGFRYSGGGYALLQMLIEDVTGESFGAFMAREIAEPLEMPGLHWAWTPALAAAAPVPYGPQGERLEYRQLGSQAIGSEIATVPAYARWVAAAVPGPNGEPAGRGVLTPETIAEMTTVQPAAGDEGLGYGVTPRGEGSLLQHFGSNSGWTAFFSLDTDAREGLVMATNSSNGFPLNAAVQNLWLAWLDSGATAAFEPAPDAGTLPLAGAVMVVLAAMLGVPLLAALALFRRDARSGRRMRVDGPAPVALARAVVWALLLAAWLYWFYTPLPLPFGPGFPDLWRMPQTHLVTAVLLAWVALSVVAARYPRRSTASAWM